MKMMASDKGTKLDMTEYQMRKKYGRPSLTQAEKEARIYDLAKRLHVQIGAKGGQQIDWRNK